MLGGGCCRIGTINSSSEELRAFSELRSCVKVEVAVLGSPSLIVRVASVDVKLQQKEKKLRPAKRGKTDCRHQNNRLQEHLLAIDRMCTGAW